MQSIVDDRGVRQDVRWFAAMGERDDETTEIARRMLTASTRRWSGRLSRRQLQSVIVVLVSLLLVAFGSTFIGRKLGLPSWTLSVVVPVAAISLGLALRGFLIERIEKARWIAKKTGRCVACVYPLTGDIEADGCTVCPECGAAWRLAVEAPPPSSLRDATSPAGAGEER